ncbi:MAG: YbaY family lipoprotein [Ignavibacteriaceae bacterium]|nr:YbaY family lipoprotein [Ignavibacteriaceae bacterium]
MKKQIILIVFMLTLPVLFWACSSSSENSGKLKLTGTTRYFEKIYLGDDADLVVKIIEEKATGAENVIAEKLYKMVSTPPIPFEIEYPAVTTMDVKKLRVKTIVLWYGEPKFESDDNIYFTPGTKDTLNLIMHHVKD